MAILALAARLAHELAFLAHGLANRFAIRDLRLADVRLDVELALHAINKDLKMQLAHAGDDRLAGFFVRANTERGIFLRETRQGNAHLFLVDLVFGSTAIAMTRLRERHAFERDHVVGRAQRVAGRDVLQAHGRGDVARANFFDFAALGRVHLQDASDALLSALDRVVDGVARVQRARIDTEERQRADERIGHDLERERRERLVVAGVRWSSLSSSSMPLTGGRSAGDGSNCTTASSIAWTPLFLNASQNTGMIDVASVPARYPR